MTEAPRKTGKWLRDDIPHTGWRCVEITEGGGICEMCEVTQITYVHQMVHERWPGWLDCGCVCAGFMTDDPATEQLREALYKWRRLQLLHRTPVEKLRRQNWHSMRWRNGRWRGNSVRRGHVDGWHGAFDFAVEISSTNGWRFHVYYGRGTHSRELTTSEPFATDLDAALAGIAWAEMLMANEQWLASDSEARAEESALRAAEDVKSAARDARQMGLEDVAITIETERLPWKDAIELIGRVKHERERRERGYPEDNRG